MPRKTRTNKSQNKQKERNIKMRAKINEIETTKNIQRINEIKSWFLQTPGKPD
jgi:hypothetical protein